MTGRGIDQILRHKSAPEIYEQWLRCARDYIEVAERVSGRIPREVDYRYIWGDALTTLETAKPDARIINLETAVTTSDERWPGKGIHYRMHPDNTPVLEAAGIDCCALANNHMLDWGYDGLEETLQSLRQTGIATAGAGEDRARAMAPAVIDAATGEIKAMRMPIFRSHKFRLSRAGKDDVSWLAEVLDRESRRLGATRVEAGAGELLLRWG